MLRDVDCSQSVSWSENSAAIIKNLYCTDSEKYNVIYVKIYNFIISETVKKINMPTYAVWV